jgi:hypothetical protein
MRRFQVASNAAPLWQPGTVRWRSDVPRVVAFVGFVLTFALAPVQPRIAREALPEEIERLWPRLVRVWPAYERFVARTQERTILVLEAPASSQA